MQPINLSRVILGGLLCGLIINIGEFILNVPILGTQWEAVAASMNKPAAFSSAQITMFNLWGFAAGIAAVWIYAAIRPRFGAGIRTAICAGLLTWSTVWLLGSVAMVVADWVPLRMWLTMMVWGLAEVTMGSVAGAWLYREEATATATRAASAP